MRLAAKSDLLEGIPPEIGVDCENETIDPQWITHNVFVDIKGDFYYASGIEQCQLERQDQLQEMMRRYCENNMECSLSQHCFTAILFIDFKAWLDKQYQPEEFVCVPTNVFDSGEQLWLAFVKKNLYNKVWVDNDWRTNGYKDTATQ